MEPATHLPALQPSPSLLRAAAQHAALESLATLSPHSFVAAGSLGVRGLVSEIHAASSADLEQLLEGAVRGLRQMGVRRAHILVEQASDLMAAAIKVGFSECPGEHLHQCFLQQPPTSTKLCPPYHRLRDGTAEDLIRIGLDLTHVEELAFKGWEFPLIRAHLNQPDRFFKVVEHQDKIVGVSIGGVFEGKGSISHTWVAPEHRNYGLGQLLSEASLTALYQAGARSVYLITVAGNVAAERFWQRQGFTHNESQIFLEIDL